MPAAAIRTPAPGVVGMRLALVTADGERLAARHFRATDETIPTDTGAYAVVFAPGFSGFADKPAVRQVAAEIVRSARSAALLLVDLRGHGRSSGISTLGDREVLDVDAAVGLARALGYRRVLTLGWSMGASCVLRHAALVGDEVRGSAVRHQPDAVITVSAVSRWNVRDTVPMRRLHRMIETRPGRLVARRVLHVRIDPRGGWPTPPLSPVEAAARLRVPLLVVHGDRDHYFDVEHARALAEATAGDAALWLVPGLGHAEEAAARPDVPGFLDQLAGALDDLAAGRPPADWQQPGPGPAIGGAA